ncbi:MAG: retropepsin-like domain-containing protein [Candidatus Omnitrophica bacterium]|nr:retropepsin-like domain-containing protein [Candidatus Omnitrophota bacterium]
MVRYRFQKENSSLGIISRPVADIKLEVNGNIVEVPMYIDSGADVSMIPLRLGKALGFKQIPSDVIYEARGISGGVPYILKEAIFILNNHRYKAKIAWALIEEIPLLLGRLDIFSRFRIIFNEKQGYIDFEEI